MNKHNDLLKPPTHNPFCSRNPPQGRSALEVDWTPPRQVDLLYSRDANVPGGGGIGQAGHLRFEMCFLFAMRRGQAPSPSVSSLWQRRHAHNQPPNEKPLAASRPSTLATSNTRQGKPSQSRVACAKAKPCLVFGACACSPAAPGQPFQLPRPCDTHRWHHEWWCQRNCNVTHNLPRPQAMWKLELSLRLQGPHKAQTDGLSSAAKPDRPLPRGVSHRKMML